jgi:hypothetical protein
MHAMKIVVPCSTTAQGTCRCGWVLPKSFTIVPATMLKGFLTAPSAKVAPFVEAVRTTCPSCGAEHACGVAEIVR